MPDHKLRPGELTDEEVETIFVAATVGNISRAIATAAYEKAMRRAAEICRKELMGTNAGDAQSDRWYDKAILSCAAAIEREAK